MKRSVENLEAARQMFIELAMANQLSSELNGLIKSGNFGVVETHHYVTLDVSGAAGEVQVLESTTKRNEGESTIHEGKLFKNQAFIYDKFGVVYGEGPTGNRGSIAFETAFPAALKNAHLVLAQKGNTLMNRPTGDFYAKGTAQDPKENYVELSIPQYWRDDEEIKASLKFAKGSSMEAASAEGNEKIIKIFAIGYSTFRK